MLILGRALVRRSSAKKRYFINRSCDKNPGVVGLLAYLQYSYRHHLAEIKDGSLIDTLYGTNVVVIVW